MKLRMLSSPVNGRLGPTRPGLLMASVLTTGRSRTEVSRHLPKGKNNGSIIRHLFNAKMRREQVESIQEQVLAKI